jgi:hypothetical protein
LLTSKNNCLASLDAESTHIMAWGFYGFCLKMQHENQAGGRSVTRRRFEDDDTAFQ